MAINLEPYLCEYVNIFLYGAAAGVGRLDKVEDKWWLREAELLVNPGAYLVKNYLTRLGTGNTEEFANFEINAEHVSAIRNISDLVQEALKKHRRKVTIEAP